MNYVESIGQQEGMANAPRGMSSFLSTLMFSGDKKYEDNDGCKFIWLIKTAVKMLLITKGL